MKKIILILIILNQYMVAQAPAWICTVVAPPSQSPPSPQPTNCIQLLNDLVQQLQNPKQRYTVYELHRPWH